MSEALMGTEWPSLQQSALQSLHYQICSQYARKTSELLYVQQAKLMMDTQTFLSSVSHNLKCNDSKNEDCSENGASAKTCDSSGGQGENVEPLFLCRKGNRAGTRNREASSFGEALLEIQARCSKKTLTTIQGIWAKYQFLQCKSSQISRKQKSLRVEEEICSKKLEQSLLIKKKLSEAESKISLLEEENRKLSSRLKEMTEDQFARRTMISMSNRKQLSATPSKDSCIMDVSSICYQSAKFIQRKIEQELWDKFESQTCLTCCLTITKLKSSILLYHSYLEQEGKYLEELVDRYQGLVGSQLEFQQN